MFVAGNKIKYLRPEKLPRALYHGTSMSRWKQISKNGLVTNQKKIYRDEESDPRIFLTSTEDNAAYYAVKTVEMEKKITEMELKKIGIKKRKSDGLILEIDTGKLDPKSFFLDSEDVSGQGWYVHFGNIPINALKRYGSSNIVQWDELQRLRLRIDIEQSEGWEKRDAKIIVDSLEFQLKKLLELEQEEIFDLHKQIARWKRYDKVATNGKFFPSLLNEIISRGIIPEKERENPFN